MISTMPTDGAPRVLAMVPRISHSPASASAWSVASAPTSSKSVYMSVSKTIFSGAPNERRRAALAADTESKCLMFMAALYHNLHLASKVFAKPRRARRMAKSAFLW